MKMMLRRLAIVVCVVLALLSAAYAFAVLRTHSARDFGRSGWFSPLFSHCWRLASHVTGGRRFPGSSGAPSSLWWPSALSRFAQ